MLMAKGIVMAALQAVTPTQERILDAAREAISEIRDTADARAAGFAPFESPDQLDRSPFQGEHWILDVDPDRRADLDRPLFILFNRMNGDLVRVGSAYLVALDPYEEPPTRIGEVDVRWHTHSWCFEVPQEGTALAHDSRDCDARGGQPESDPVAMIHVWTDAPSPHGLFAHDNPALPFMAVGLEPPTPAQLADEKQGPKRRMLALALGETYDARMEYARRIERRAGSGPIRERLVLHREAITALVPRLVDAQSAGRKGEFETLASNAIGHWQALYKLYIEAAPNSALRTQVIRQYLSAIHGSHDATQGGHRH
jgi:hypothetical protein